MFSPLLGKSPRTFLAQNAARAYRAAIEFLVAAALRWPATPAVLGTTYVKLRSCYGQSGGAVSPADSGWPVIRLAFCTACPAAPLPRLSMAAIATTNPLCAFTA